MSQVAFRADLFHMTDDPALVGAKDACGYIPDGLLVVEDGFVKAVGSYDALAPTLKDGTEITDHRGKLITPGFIDTHIHFPQLDMIASYGEQLLDWLERYTFPEEAKFASEAHAADAADFFIRELLSSGTTSALVYCTVHRQSVEAIFDAAYARNMRIVAGKSLMDRNVPDAVRDTAEGSDRDNRDLIAAYHGKGRLGYAITPRFAPACSDEQLTLAGKLLAEHDDVLMHTHLSENTAEIDWVRELYPEAKNYLDVYDRFGLLTNRSVFAHCIHLDGEEFQRMAEADAAISYCPTSNLFLGSGLFNLREAEKYGVKVGLGTDVGAGTSFSLLETMNEAYKVCHLRGHRLDPFKSFYLATLGGAKALNMADKVGDFTPGKEADFIVLDRAATPLLERRLKNTSEIDELLFVLSMLGDDRTVSHTYVAGECVHTRD
ncbi:guanine deaminase [Kordiimonas gwangyangensis]|uniref:guanine deaminase n=1 Tax=Kordiimonas gwangyangensis TaxID=288022 RepID=UPI000362ADC4|nr:guanine deaminase [Kordiimonas gwangyangensis]